MRNAIQRKVKSKRTGQITTHTYDSISGVPINQYFRDWSRAHYIPRPRAEKPNLSPELTQTVIDLHNSGVSQLEICRRLGITRFRVRRALGKR